MFATNRRTILWITSMILLLLVLLVFTKPWSTIGTNARQVALKSSAEVDRIVVADAFDSTVLIRQNENWLIHGEEVAGIIPVENLLIAAERLEISSIVSSDSESLRSPGRTISYFRGQKRILTYTLQVKDKQYLITPIGSENSYFVKVSGYPGLNLEKVFSSTSNHYREHLLIDLLPSEISRIETELQDGESYEFMQDQRDNITCYFAGSSEPVPAGELNDVAVRLLFSYFTSIVYEDKSGILVDDLFQADPPTTPLARVHVESFEGEKHTLEVFPYVENPGEKAHMFKALVAYNEESETLIVNYIYLDVLMRNWSHFVGDK